MKNTIKNSGIAVGVGALSGAGLYATIGGVGLALAKLETKE